MSATAIVHPSDLLGKELTETLEKRAKQWREVRLLSTLPDEIGGLTDVAGAAALVAPYDPDSLQGASTIYFCGPIAANRPLFQDVPPGATAVVLSPDATPEDGQPVVAGVNSEAARVGQVLVSPHPAVVLLAHLLHPLRGMATESMTATVIQPASMSGNPGLEELFEQTRQIVAMAERRPTSIFGAQLAFNLLPTPADSLPLAATLQRVLGDLVEPGEAGGQAGQPSLAIQLLQGGVFHSLSASVYLRLDGKATVQSVRKALAAHPYLEPADRPKHLGPIDAAAHDRVLFGNVRKDVAGGFWLWAVMDNLTRGGALNAVEIVEGLQ
jgi:aspartate-semialdehyde dehydrogenase